MRHNLPVTGTEFPFPTGQTLVSTTDRQGRILYCNQRFIEVSGFSKEELIGQPHNLIRHPDMPEEAFRDMWATISSGRPWSAPVKNRRKNGDHYWVMANATPLLSEGRPIGYMSVRTELSRAQIDQAEQLYARMRAEQASGRVTTTLREGRVLRQHGIARWVDRLHLPMSGQVLGVLLALVMGSATLSAMAQRGDWLWLSLLIEAGCALLAWAYLRARLVQPIGTLIACAHRMAAGDLTPVRLNHRDDEVGQLQRALNQLNVTLMSIVRDAREESVLMVDGSQTIARGNEDLSRRTDAQASQLQETAASMERMLGTVTESADSARQASNLAQHVSEQAAGSRQAVDELGETMREIEEASSRINDITHLIDDIAFQTNILALNAAVEAARAGDEGRGFAVVAGEVRALAHRAGSAAKEIRALIDRAGAKVADGRDKTEAVQAAMVAAVKGVERVNTLVHTISQKANEQLSGIAQINAAVSELDTITQQNTAMVDDMAASAQTLAHTAQAVKETVQIFKLPDAVDARVA